ncbi:DNA cytosine methyltransferase [Methylobacterium sp. J-090]|uniref:DNA cytosine methyltransferase n=1 Tax=Methylobacterium sp. J-090 TaxID=2836666 RepID=UPI001FBB21DD|nr:DNA cytosine methyltransferase [Methylobacterium sp. J-090]MCJ2084303.1 DNA cytosine methyltransferase [Methylobacterium sp. J-090]
MRAEVVDLFCGIGGLSAGFRSEGFDVVAGIDLDGTCRYAYERNIGARFIAGDLGDVSVDEIAALYSGTARRVLVGCAPCQPFSMYTGRYRKAPDVAPADLRWRLLEEFARIIEGLKPDVVSMENVPRVALHPVFAEFVERLRNAGYHVRYDKVRADHYGVPQKRARLVLLASLHGHVELVPPTHRKHPRTVRDAIGDLPALVAGVPDSTDRLHVTRGLSEKNLSRIRSTKEGGSWRDWSSDLKLDCHKKAGGESFRAVYGRMSWDEPSPVITTQCLGIGNGRFGHPVQDRAISIREASLLQSFPADFEFVGPDEPVNQLRLSRQIGNAVPVRLAGAIAQSIQQHLTAIPVPMPKSPKSRIRRQLKWTNGWVRPSFKRH